MRSPRGAAKRSRGRTKAKVSSGQGPGQSEASRPGLAPGQRQLLQGLPQLAWTCTPEGYESDLNQRWLDYTGLTAHDSGETGWLARVPIEEQASLGASWGQTRQAGTPYARELRLRGRDGSHRWFETQATPLLGPSGAIDLWLWTGTDVTARRVAEEQLRDEQEPRKQTDLLAKVGGWGFDPVSGRGRWTEEVARIHDLDETHVSLPLVLQFYEGEHRARLETAVQQAMSEGASYDLEVEQVSAG